MRLPISRPLAIALALLALLALGLVAPQPAAAHPLGNFSINSYCRIEPSAAGLRLRYVLDLAEIPTFQRLSAAGGDGVSATPEQLAAIADELAAELAEELLLEADGHQLQLTPGERTAQLRDGQGGLSSLYVTVELAASLPGGAGPWELSYDDPLYAPRAGWHELVVRAGDGARLIDSSAPAEDRSAELTAYPEDQLSAPLSAAGARFSFALGAPGASAAPDATVLAAAPQSDALAALAVVPSSGPFSLLTALFAALLLGAGHALTPGHGKTIVAAYLVGSRGTVHHALFLGLTTTITHTAGVFALGLLTLFFAEWMLPEQLYPWLGAISGALVVLIGVTLLRQRLRALLDRPAAPHSDDAHADLDAAGGHDHGFGYHRHAPTPTSTSWRGLLALGVAGGLLPCPSALVLLLGAVALGQPALGLLLVLGFSLGLAGVLTGIGVLLVRARGLFGRLPGGGRLLPGLSVAGAAVVTIAGLAITAQALVQAGILG
jgi:ABC-type nickel/cobalt efflux system permease component RcnA